MKTIMTTAQDQYRIAADLFIEATSINEITDQIRLMVGASMDRAEEIARALVEEIAGRERAKQEQAATIAAMRARIDVQDQTIAAMRGAFDATKSMLDILAKRAGLIL